MTTTRPNSRPKGMILPHTMGWEASNAFLGLITAYPYLNPSGRTLHVLKGMALTYKAYTDLRPFALNGDLYVD